MPEEDLSHEEMERSRQVLYESYFEEAVEKIEKKLKQLYTLTSSAEGEYFFVYILLRGSMDYLLFFSSIGSPKCDSRNASLVAVVGMMLCARYFYGL